MDECCSAPQSSAATREPSLSSFAFRPLRARDRDGEEPFDDAYVIVKDAVAPGATTRVWRGYVVFRKGEDSAIARWHGGDTAAREPGAALAGNWKFVAGTGRFGEISGGGTFEARETNPGQFAFQWKGRFELGQPARPGRSPGQKEKATA